MNGVVLSEVVVVGKVDEEVLVVETATVVVVEVVVSDVVVVPVLVEFTEKESPREIVWSVSLKRNTSISAVTTPALSVTDMLQ